MGLHAEENSVGCEAGQTPLQIGLATQLLSLSIEVVESLDGLLELLLINLREERSQHIHSRGLGHVYIINIIIDTEH